MGLLGNALISTGVNAANVGLQNLGQYLYSRNAPITQYQQAMMNQDNTSYQRAVHDMEMAGLNPAMMYSSGNRIAPTTSVGGVNSTPQVDILGGMNQLYQNESLKQDAEYQRIVNITQLQKQISEIEGQIADNKKKGVDTSIAEANLHILNETMESMIHKTNNEALMSDVDLDIKISESQIKAVEAKYAEIEKQLSLESTSANIEGVYASIDLVKAQTDNEKVKTEMNMVDLWLKRATAEAQAEMVQLQRDIMSLEKQFDEQTLDARIQEIINKSGISELEFEKMLAESQYFESNAKWDSKKLKMETRTGYAKAVTSGIRDVCIGINQVASAINPLIPKFKSKSTYEYDAKGTLKGSTKVNERSR